MSGKAVVNPVSYSSVVQGEVEQQVTLGGHNILELGRPGFQFGFDHLAGFWKYILPELYLTPLVKGIIFLFLEYHFRH